MNNTENDYLYVIFSATPYKVGKMIRCVTKNVCNHVSVSLDPTLTEVYSFARYHINNPLYAGFVRESPMRYRISSEKTFFHVCAVPLDARQSRLVRARLRYYIEHADEYIYNTASAAATAFGHRIVVRNSYTCAEFCNHLMRGIGIETGCSHGVCDIGTMERTLSPYTIFEGNPEDYNDCAEWGTDRFPVRQKLRRRAICLYENHKELLKRLTEKR